MMEGLTAKVVEKNEEEFEVLQRLGDNNEDKYNWKSTWSSSYFYSIFWS